MTILSTPSSVDLSMTDFMAGIRISQPSSPKRFSEDHRLAKNDSNLEGKNIYINMHLSITISHKEDIS